MNVPTRNALVRLWKGDLRLWQAFWLFGVLGHVVALVVLATAAYLTKGSPVAELPTLIVTIALYYVYAAYTLVGLWRCAPNVHTQAFGALARTYVLAMLAIAAYNAFMLVRTLAT